MDFPAFARGVAPWDSGIRSTDISVNDTLLASKVPVAASTTHPHRNRHNLSIVILDEKHNCPVTSQAGVAHIAATAQVPHD
jgi:hypothetical protein